MRRQLRLIAALLCAGVLAAGCGGNGAEDAAEPLSLDEYASRSVAAFCAKTEECCGAPSSGEAREECEAMSSAGIDRFVELVEESQEAGRSAYDPQAAGGCVQRIETLDCSTFDGLGLGAVGLVCEPLLVPMVELGGACAMDDECLSDFCDLNLATGMGTCIEAPGEGDPCTRCPLDLYCDDDGGEAVCRELKELGAACERSHECETGKCVDDVCVDTPLCELFEDG